MSGKTRIIHNPRCSKSRATLALLEERGVDFEIIRYLETPLVKSELISIINMLGITAHDMVRKGEAEYKALGDNVADLSQSDLLDYVVTSPILLERPIVIHKDRAAIGRPPENVLSLFD